MGMEGLTAKQSAFCHAIALDGLGPSSAYRRVYSSTMLPDAVASNAKKLLRRSPIRTHIEELKGAATPGGHGLTPRQDAFCLYYLESSNASEAYRRAYEVAPTTKVETVNCNAHALLQNTKIAARVAQLRVGVWRRHAVAIDRLVEEYARLSFGNIADLIDWGTATVARDRETGEIVARAGVALKADAPRSAWAAVKSIEVSRTRFQLTMHDKSGALDSLAKYLGLFDANTVHRAQAAANPADPTLDRGSLAPADLWRLLAAPAADSRTREGVPDKARLGPYNTEAER